MKSSILFITGLSGSGKTIALRAMEDAGYFCVDNLPASMIESFASTLSEKSNITRIAIGIDVREREFLSSVNSVIQPLRRNYDLAIVFLEADKDTLIRRFKETRRPHPLMSDKVKDIEQAITIEKGLLLNLREAADKIIDTSNFTPHQLRQYIISHYGSENSLDTMNITIMSFGYKFGVPQNADLLFDVRFLPNPHFVPELKDLTGSDEPVKEYVLQREPTADFIDRLKGLLDFLIPLYRKEGKSHLTIGIGCTGGKHRSIVIAEKIASLMKENSLNVNVVHRDK